MTGGARQLQVLQVTARFLPELGGTERHVMEVASRLPGLGIATAVLTTDAVGDLPPAEVMGGIQVRRTRTWPSGWDLRWAPGLASAIREGAWDVVHVQGIHTLVPPLAMAASRRAHIPYVITFHSGGHSSSIRSWLRPVQWTALRPLLRSAEQLIGVSEFEADHFSRVLHLSRRRFVVIPNGSNVGTSTNGAAVVDPDLIVAVGRLERYKGHHRIVGALPQLVAQRPNTRLRIVGDGPDRMSLLRQAAELGVSDRLQIEPIDASDRDGMASLLSRAGVVALLSDYEAHPVAVMEALSLGRPVVVADTSGLREIARRGWARAVAADASPAEVAGALLAGLGDRTGPIPDLPTWDEAAARLAALYRSLARRPD